MHQQNNPSLQPYYHFAATVPAIVSFIGMIIYTAIDVRQTEASGYESEFVAADSMVGYALFITIAHCFLVCLLCGAIFLNKTTWVREHTIPCFLSWFGAPSIYLGYIFFQGYNAQSTLMENMFLYMLVAPFVAGLIATFIHYRIKQNAPATT